MQVSGAGSSDCNGVYERANVPPGFTSVSHYFELDAAHSVYENSGVWHLAHLGVEVWYQSLASAPSTGGPPSTGWVAVGGAAPPPTELNSTHGPNVTTASSLYLYLRTPGGTVRRNVQLRDT